MATKQYIWVKNQSGRGIEVEASQWPDLEKKGFVKLGSSPTNTTNSVVAGSPPSQPSDPNAADLNLVAAFQANNGMGRVGEELLLSLDRLGAKVNVQPLFIQEDGLMPKTLELISRQYKPSKKTLVFSIPQVLEKYHTEETYLHVPWDTTKAPDEWVTEINRYCKKVYPTSHFTRETFLKSGVKVPLETIKHGVNPDRFFKLDRDWNGLFTFTTLGDISTRKGTDVLIKAFQKAFPKTVKNVQLIIKSNHTLDWGRIQLPDDERIRVIEKPMTHTEMLTLLGKTHCGVFPSRSEGFGLPALETMATGACVILHNAGGLSMMANDKYNIPITSDGEMPAPDWMYPESYSQGGGIGNWTNPDLKSLAANMKFVFQQRDRAKEIGDRAAKWVRMSWSWDSQVERMYKEILDIKAEKTWGDFYNGDVLTKGNVQSSVNSHKEFFWLLKSFKADKIIETGCGTGEMAGYLTWGTQAIEGKVPTTHKPKEVIAVDIDPKVIKIARANLEAIDGKKAILVQADAWKYNEEADLIFSQGLLEHFSDEQLRSLVTHQLEQAPVLLHSVPNNDYGKRDFGNERLLSDSEWYRIFEGFDMKIYRYWDEDGKKKQTVLIFNRKDIKRPKVSIIMCVWNHKDMTIKAIEAIRKTSKDYELIVVDNNSTDGIGEWLEFQKDIRTIHVSQNLGVPKAKNLAMACSRGEYICFMDNDTVAGDGWQEQLLDVFKDTTVGFTGHEGYMIDYEGRSFLGPKHETTISPEWIPGSVFMFPARLIRDVGMLLDTDLWCVEDVDYCARIRNTGLVGKLPSKKLNLVHLVSQTANKFDFSVERFNQHAGNVWTKWGKWLQENKHVTGIKIDIGVGEAPAQGYLHVDIQDRPHVEIIADTRHLPFENNTVSEVRNAHIIEHFNRVEVNDVFREWVRVLKKEGLLRVICPDFKKICDQFTRGEISAQQALLWTYGGQIDEYDYHYWMYTPESLMDKFKEFGLGNVSWRYNENGWLEVIGEKQEDTPGIAVESGSSKKKNLKVGVYVTHVHTHGGGENATFQVIKMLKDLYPDLEVISSEDWQIDPKEFGIDLPKIKKVDLENHYDVFINISHFELHKPLGDINLAYVFYPQYNWKEQLKAYQGVVTISEFSKREIRRLWEVEADVVFPATETAQFYTDKKKEPLILSVGRFFHVEGGNNKNHSVMIEAFKQLPLGWKLVLVGTVQDKKYLDNLKEMAKGYNIEFKHDITFAELTNLYSKAKYYWHAAGYKATNPSSQEHFGMVAVEAMASGCQPVVYDGGGMAEIKGVKTWTEPSTLVLKTQLGTTMPDKLVKTAQLYSPEEVKKSWKKTITRHLR